MEIIQIPSIGQTSRPGAKIHEAGRSPSLHIRLVRSSCRYPSHVPRGGIVVLRQKLGGPGDQPAEECIEDPRDLEVLAGRSAYGDRKMEENGKCAE